MNWPQSKSKSNRWRYVRYVRIVVAIAVAVLMGVCALWPTATVACAGRWLLSLQVIPAILALSGLWIVIWTAVTLIGGRIYCSTACPLGTCADAVSWLRRTAGRPRSRDYRWRVPLTAVRILALLVMVEGLAIGVPAIVHNLDPAADYMALARLGMWTAVSGWLSAAVIAVVVVAMSWRHGRLMCNTICPVGAILGAGSSVALMHFEINPDTCTHCGACESVCKSCCIDQKHNLVDNSRCVACFDCMAVCPNGAMRWRRGRHRLQWPLLMRTTGTSTAPSAIIKPSPSSAKTDNETIS